MFFPGRVAAQSMQGKIIDSDTKQGIPFVQLLPHRSLSKILTDINGNFSINPIDSVEISHPIYETRSVILEKYDTTFIIELNKKKEIQTTEEQLQRGDDILSKHHEYLTETSSAYHDSFEFLSYTKIEV
ncbi:MAG: hypothetical protein KAI29_13055, partial [Cyclobacteriaceae bacterium]|nr:hypothetical protein [Cyclobacteriaceae bacterium]